MGVQFILCLNRRGKVRLQRWYCPCDEERRRFTIEDVHYRVGEALAHGGGNTIPYGATLKLVFKRYNGVTFIVCVPCLENELYYLQSIPAFVRELDMELENVSELDLVYNFHKMDAILDRFYNCGELMLKGDN